GPLDPAAADRALASASPAVRALLDTLSPERLARDVRAPIVLVHARDDAVVPFTESLRLAAAARPDQATLVIVDAMGHVGAVGSGPEWGTLARLWAVAYRLVSAA